MLPVLFITSIVTIILVGLFVSPRLVLRMTVVTLVMSIVLVLLELWSPLSPLHLPVAVLLFGPVVVLLVGYLVHLFGHTLSQALEASQSYSGELERSQAQLVL